MNSIANGFMQANRHPFIMSSESVVYLPTYTQ